MTERIQNQNTKQKTALRPGRWSARLVNSILLGLMVVGIFGYLVQVNAAVVNAYMLRDLEHRLHEVKLANRSLEIKNQQEQSVNTVMTKIAAMGLVKTSQVEYLASPGGNVALAR